MSLSCFDTLMIIYENIRVPLDSACYHDGLFCYLYRQDPIFYDVVQDQNGIAASEFFLLNRDSGQFYLIKDLRLTTQNAFSVSRTISVIICIRLLNIGSKIKQQSLKCCNSFLKTMSCFSSNQLYYMYWFEICKLEFSVCLSFVNNFSSILPTFIVPSQSPRPGTS